MYQSMEDQEPRGTIVFTTIGRAYYGFDIFSVKLGDTSPTVEQCLTDGCSINFNGQFIDEDQSLVYISERKGSTQIFLNQQQQCQTCLTSETRSLFHDRPIVKDGQLYFVSAHENPDQPFKSWCAVYASTLHDKSVNLRRLTPSDSVDYSPAISESGKLMAVASYGSLIWGGESQHLLTDIVVFPPSNPSRRTLVCHNGGWPTWSGDSTIFFHRQAEDGWWSIFRIDLLLTDHDQDSKPLSAQRVTPPGIHSFTPAAVDHHAKQITVATRRSDSDYRHIEIFNLVTGEFYPVTKLLNPSLHHYNPFVSPGSSFLGYHRFRGESSPGDSIVPHLEPVISPINGLSMLRINGLLPCFSPGGDLIAFNHAFSGPNAGLKIVRSDGSKRWTLIKGRTAFHNSWSPSEKHVIYTSIGPIFESVKKTVQIARVEFDPADLDNDKEDIAVNVKILTRDDTGNNAFPACSPDGNSIVFRSGRSGHKNLYIINAVDGELKGGDIIQLTDGPWIDTMPAWSPDGTLVAFSSNRHNPDNVEAFSIYVVNRNGTDARRIHVGGGDRERINHVFFSGDGKWLLFTANLGGVTAEPVSIPNQFQPYGDLHIVRSDGSGGLRRLTCNGYENGTPTWHPMNNVDGFEHRPVDGDKLKGQFDEPLWIKTADVVHA